MTSMETYTTFKTIKEPFLDNFVTRNSRSFSKRPRQRSVEEYCRYNLLKYTMGIDYEQAARDYDASKYAIGAEAMTSILVGLLRKKAKRISMLEVGCGKGDYSLGFLQNGIGELTMTDKSEEMLALAKSKVSEFSKKVKEIKQHQLPMIPYPDDSFDVVSLIQVLHNLDTNEPDDTELDTPSNDFPNLRKAVQEAYRVLKPQGVLLIDHNSHMNLDVSWLSKVPKRQTSYTKINLSGTGLIEVLKEEKFKDIFRFSRPGVEFSKEAVFEEPELLLNEQFLMTNADEYAFTEKTGDLPGVFELLEMHKQNGTLNEFVEKHNGLFRMIGETTSLYARKLDQSDSLKRYEKSESLNELEEKESVNGNVTFESLKDEEKNELVKSVISNEGELKESEKCEISNEDEITNIVEKPQSSIENVISEPFDEDKDETLSKYKSAEDLDQVGVKETLDESSHAEGLDKDGENEATDKSADNLNKERKEEELSKDEMKKSLEIGEVNETSDKDKTPEYLSEDEKNETSQDKSGDDNSLPWSKKFESLFTGF